MMHVRECYLFLQHKYYEYTWLRVVHEYQDNEKVESIVDK